MSEWHSPADVILTSISVSLIPGIGTCLTSTFLVAYNPQDQKPVQVYLLRQLPVGEESVLTGSNTAAVIAFAIILIEFDHWVAVRCRRLRNAVT